MPRALDRTVAISIRLHGGHHFHAGPDVLANHAKVCHQRSEIDLAALVANFRVIREHVGPGVKVMAAVKANAYGHGAVECARHLEAEGADWFGVALPEEGVELRSAGIAKPILCLGGFWD